MTSPALRSLTMPEEGLGEDMGVDADRAATPSPQARCPHGVRLVCIVSVRMCMASTSFLMRPHVLVFVGMTFDSPLREGFWSLVPELCTPGAAAAAGQTCRQPALICKARPPFELAPGVSDGKRGHTLGGKAAVYLPVDAVNDTRYRQSAANWA